MKALKFLIILVAVLSLLPSPAQAQTISFAASVPVYAANFYKDSVTVNSSFASDTIFTSFRAPFKVNIVAWEVYMSTIDTGSAASAEPSLTRSFCLKKSTSGTPLSKIIPTSASANVYSYDVASFPVRLSVGEIVRVIWTCGTGVRYKQVMVRIWYTRV
jgi:hypothetical protein